MKHLLTILLLGAVYLAKAQADILPGATYTNTTDTKEYAITEDQFNRILQDINRLKACEILEQENALLEQKAERLAKIVDHYVGVDSLLTTGYTHYANKWEETRTRQMELEVKLEKEKRKRLWFAGGGAVVAILLMNLIN